MLQHAPGSPRFSHWVAGLTRLIAWVALGASMLALGLGRVHPEAPTARMPAVRGPGPPRPVYIRQSERSEEADSTLWIDPRTGRTTRVAEPAGGRLINASLSPWQEGRGGAQLVGHWTAWGREGRMGAPDGFFLVRIAQPGGTTLDRIPLNGALVGPPCWFPGDAARVLFAMPDGHLYVHSFEGRRGRDPDAGAATRPRRLTWQVPRPWGERGCPSGLSWPTDARLGGRVLASAYPRSGGPDGGRHDEPQLWWLRLDASGTAVAEVGCLGPPRPGDGPDGGGVERSPVVAATAGGDLALAYLYRPRGRRDWQLRLAPVQIDARTGAPVARTDAGRVVAEGCYPTEPVFSPDGRWVFGVVSDAGRLRVRRLAVTTGTPPPRLDVLDPPGEGNGVADTSRGDHDLSMLRSPWHSGYRGQP
jgi:hypothetical protein